MAGVEEQQMAEAEIQGKMQVVQAKYQAEAQKVMAQEQAQMEQGMQGAAPGEPGYRVVLSEQHTENQPELHQQEGASKVSSDVFRP